MPRTDLQKKLEKLTARRDRLKVDLERKKGRLEESERRLEELKDKCREKKIDPENLEGVVKKLETRFEEELDAFQEGLDGAHACVLIIAFVLDFDFLYGKQGLPKGGGLEERTTSCGRMATCSGIPWANMSCESSRVASDARRAYPASTVVSGGHNRVAIGALS